MCQGIVDLPIFFDTGSVRFVLCGGRWSCNCSGVGVSIFRSVLVISTVGLLVRSLSRICLGRRRVIVLRDWFRDRLNGSYRRDGLRRLRGLCSGGGTRSGLIRIIARKKGLSQKCEAHLSCGGIIQISEEIIFQLIRFGHGGGLAWC